MLSSCYLHQYLFYDFLTLIMKLYSKFAQLHNSHGESFATQTGISAMTFQTALFTFASCSYLATFCHFSLWRMNVKNYRIRKSTDCCVERMAKKVYAGGGIRSCQFIRSFNFIVQRQKVYLTAAS